MDAHVVYMPFIGGWQKDLNVWMEYYNNERRTHQGKIWCGRTPLEALLDEKQIWVEKKLTQI